MPYSTQLILVGAICFLAGLVLGTWVIQRLKVTPAKKRATAAEIEVWHLKERIHNLVSETLTKIPTPEGRQAYAHRVEFHLGTANLPRAWLHQRSKK